MKPINVTIEKTKTGYSAFADRISVFTTGGSLKELSANMVEAVQLHYDNPRLSKKNLRFRFSIPSLFDLYPINIRQFAGRIEMNYTLLSQYVQGRKVPSEKQSMRIVQGLRDVGQELGSISIK